MTVYDILQALKATSKTNEKKAILEQHLVKTDNASEFGRVLWLTLNPFILFGIKKIPEARPTGNTIQLKDAMDFLVNLSEKKIPGGNTAIFELSKILGSLSKEDAYVVERIIEKDLDCGVGATLVNKILEDYIPEYKLMLAQPCKEKTLAKIKYPAIADLKADGMRFNAHITEDSVHFLSRQGQKIFLWGRLEQDFIEMYNGYGDVVVDGEFLVVDENEQELPRQTGNGILNKAIKATISPEEADQVRAVVWDIVTMDEFKAGRSDTILKDRKATIQTGYTSWRNAFPNTRPKITPITSDVVSNIEEAEEIFKKYLELGKEGIILKNMNSPWVNKRSPDQVKMKAEEDCDLLCVGWEEGTGKYEGMMGALKLESSDGLIKVNVGTGFTDEHRQLFTADYSVGKIVKVVYNVRVKDKRTGQESLFLPRFVEFRDDKFTADSSSLIK